jgi:hypothetical protein
MSAMSIQLGNWLIKQTDKGDQSVRSHFDEILYRRYMSQAQQIVDAPDRTNVVKSHQLQSLTRLYQAGELEKKLTFATPSTRINHIVGLVREDITELEVDM